MRVRRTPARGGGAPAPRTGAGGRCADADGVQTPSFWRGSRRRARRRGDVPAPALAPAQRPAAGWQIVQTTFGGRARGKWGGGGGGGCLVDVVRRRVGQHLAVDVVKLDKACAPRARRSLC